MGFSPVQIDEMSIWAFLMARKGYAEHHGGKEKSSGEMDEDRMRELGIEGM